jgi:hypothetical protein
MSPSALSHKRAFLVHGTGLLHRGAPLVWLRVHRDVIRIDFREGQFAELALIAEFSETRTVASPWLLYRAKLPARDKLGKSGYDCLLYNRDRKLHKNSLGPRLKKLSIDVEELGGGVGVTAGKRDKSAQQYRSRTSVQPSLQLRKGRSSPEPGFHLP